MNIPWLAVQPIPENEFSAIKKKMIFENFKWDPQVEDVSTLSPFPIILKKDEWKKIASYSEKLTKELLCAEKEILQKSHLVKKLGIPCKLKRLFKKAGKYEISAEAARVIRFDFHFTTEGWKISEANTDVPGGFNEASGFTKIIASYYKGYNISADPVEILVNDLLKHSDKNKTIALVYATSYTDDRQVMEYLAKEFVTFGIKSYSVSPDHIRWENGIANLNYGSLENKLDFIIRFFPAEWLPNLPGSSHWKNYFFGSKTPICNPGSAFLSQSKRFPLIWNELETDLTTWKAMLPATYSMDEISWKDNEGIVLKPSCGRVGENIRISGVTGIKESKKIEKYAGRYPGRWVAQERFDPVPFELNNKKYFPCFGVYTINGKAAGIYGRISAKPLITYDAQEISVLIDS